MVRQWMILFGVVVAICSTFARAEDAPRPPPASDLPELRTRLAALLQQERIPGMGVALLKDHQLLWADGIGLADTAQQRPVTADTPFLVGSVSKSFTALAVMKLVEAGRIDLDAPIRRYLPDAPIDNPWEATNPVTVAQVLEHSAGFDDLHFSNFVTDRINLPVATAVAENAASLSVRWQPGQRFSYSNPGYLLAGALVERVSGIPFDDYMEREILRPLGMGQASYRHVADGGLAQGYNDALLPEDYPHAGDRPAGALRSSTRELAGFVLALMNRELPILSRDSLLRVETPSTTAAARAGLRTGYGLGNEGVERNGFSLRRHTGGVLGYSAYYAYEPQHGFGFVLLINRMAAPKVITDTLVDYLTQDLVPPTAAAVAVSARQLESYHGYYRSGSPGMQTFAWVDAVLDVSTVVSEGDALFLRPLLGERERLLPTGEHRFRKEADSAATFAFVPQPDGKWVLVGRHQYLEPVSPVSAWAPLGLSLVALLSWLIGLLCAPRWLLAWRRNRLPHAGRALRVWPLLASLSVLVHFGLMITMTIAQMGRLNVGSVLLCLTTLALVVFTGLSVLALWRAWSLPLGRFQRWQGVTATLSAVWLSVWWGAFGYLGVRFWA